MNSLLSAKNSPFLEIISLLIFVGNCVAATSRRSAQPPCC
jgi:hypothetical protein